jgi:prepilin-type N-terminal cleavage/methylation domain-containing protein
LRSLFSKLAAQVRKSEAGFTLVELLVVVGIIVALAAVIIPNVAKFTGKGTEGAEAAEAENVQTAFDTLMANAGVAQIEPRVNPDTALNDFSGGEPFMFCTTNPHSVGGQTVDLEDYMRVGTSGTTNSFYCWDTSGLITAIATSAVTCS